MRIKLFESYNEYAKLLSIKPQIEDILIDLGDYDDVEYNLELNGDKEDCELRLDVKLYNIEYISGVMNILNRVAKLLDEEELIYKSLDDSGNFTDGIDNWAEAENVIGDEYKGTYYYKDISIYDKNSIYNESLSNKIPFEQVKQIVHDILVDLDDLIEYKIYNELQGVLIKDIRLKMISNEPPGKIEGLHQLLNRLFKVLRDEGLVTYQSRGHGTVSRVYDDSVLPWEEKHEYDYSGIYAKCVGVTWEKEFVLYYEN